MGLLKSRITKRNHHKGKHYEHYYYYSRLQRLGKAHNTGNNEMLITVEQTTNTNGTRYQITYCRIGKPLQVRIAYNELEAEYLATIDPFNSNSALLRNQAS